MLKLKLQNFGHLLWRTDSLENTLRQGKIEARRRRGNRGRDGWMGSLIQWTWVWADSGSRWCTGKPGMLQSMGLHRVRHDWVNWNELNWRRQKTYIPKAIRCWWMKSKMPQKDSKIYHVLGPSMVSQMIKILPAVWETWVWSLGWEDTVEQGITTHSSIFA